MQLLHSSFHEKVNWVKNYNRCITIKHRWRKRLHIHVSEAAFVVLVIRWMMKNAANHKMRVILFTNSTTVLGSLKNVLSSRLALNNVCRRVAASLLHGDRKLVLFYIPSADDPTDGPSRYLCASSAEISRPHRQCIHTRFITLLDCILENSTTNASIRENGSPTNPICS